MDTNHVMNVLKVDRARQLAKETFKKCFADHLGENFSHIEALEFAHDESAKVYDLYMNL